MSESPATPAAEPVEAPAPAPVSEAPAAAPAPVAAPQPAPAPENPAPEPVKAAEPTPEPAKAPDPAPEPAAKAPEAPPAPPAPEPETFVQRAEDEVARIEAGAKAAVRRAREVIFGEHPIDHPSRLPPAARPCGK